MKIVEGKISSLLEGKVQFQVPIYQRKYSWEKGDCEKLFEDIVKVSEDAKRKKHFIGSVIYMSREETQNISTIEKYDLIDGQQRITTLSILLVALGDYAKEYMSKDEYEKSEFSFEALKEDYLINKRVAAADDDYFKLCLTEEDDKVYKALLQDRKLPTGIEESKVFSNYNAFLKQMRNSHKAPSAIFAGIKKLTLGDVSLVPDDDAQLVFETVNSTGKPLSVADKIRNFILMNADKATQNRIYKNYWHTMENNFGYDKTGIKNLQDFMYYYVGVISQNKVTTDYYDIFKSYFLGISKDEVETVVADIYEFSKCYIEWLNTSSASKNIDALLYNIKATGQWKIIPAVLQILHSEKNSLIDREEASEMLKVIESYIVRRQLCNLPSNSAGEAYVSMQKKVSSLAELKVCINGLSEKQSMPNDEMLRSTLHTQKLYGSYGRIREVLDRMEQFHNKDYTHTDAHSIEHIMPQTVMSHDELYARADISDEKKAKLDWEGDIRTGLRDVHEAYCDTIGNLTLTGYNSEYQNYRFLVKRDMQDSENSKRYGYKYTPIHLSSSLALLEVWDKNAIIKRADEMIDTIIKIWAYPTIIDPENSGS